jgi:hypothetical protein
MKKIIAASLLVLSIALSAAEFNLYVIPPKVPISWASRRDLAITTGLNSLQKDYAPIGHFIVEVKCQVPNRFGVRHLITGIERESKKKVSVLQLKVNWV